MAREKWKRVVGWPGYEVSDRGRVISFKLGAASGNKAAGLAGERRKGEAACCGGYLNFREEDSENI